MSLVEEYYELNEAEEVSVVWKILHILLYWSAGTLGLSCGFTLALLRQKFDDKCYLFTEVEAAVKEDWLDQCNINWENDSWCDYYQFSMVSSFIVAIIWGTLFLMCGKGGKSLTGLPQPWRIVCPSLLFNFIYFIITLSTAINIQRGTDHFRSGYDFDDENIESKLEKCESLRPLLKKNLYPIAIQIEMVVKASWGCTFSWFSLFLLSFFRILFIVDFHMYKICVFKLDDTVQNKKEEVLKITNYEEPRKLYFGKNDERRISDSENIPKDTEMGTRKKTKTEKKSTRQNINTSNRLPHKPNTVFYETADIRMLNRQKKRKTPYKGLDEAFGKNISNFGFGMRKCNKMQPNSHVSLNSETPTFLYQYSKELYNEEDEEDDSSSFSSNQRHDFHEDRKEPGSENEIFVGDFDSNRFLRFKKQI